MPTFRLCFLYGRSYSVTIDEDVVTLPSLRKTIETHLPPLREMDEYMCVVSGKPPHRLNLDDEQEFNEYRTLITTGCYVWMKLK